MFGTHERVAPRSPLEPSPKCRNAGRRGAARAKLVLFAAALALLVAGIVWGVLIVRSRAAAERERDAQHIEDERRAAEQVAEPIRAALRAPEPAETVAKPDIDKTFAVLHALDRAARDASSMNDYVQTLARMDYRGIDPAAKQVRLEMLDAFVELSVRLRDVDTHDAVWSSYQALLRATALANSVNVGAAVFGAHAGMRGDETARRSAVDELHASLAEKAELARHARAFEADLLRIVDRNAPVVHGLVERWQKLCLVRDSAYLAAARQDYAACARFADEAIDVSPLECEAHLLRALANIEGGIALPGENTALEQYLGDFLDRHPDWAAPVLLLRGVSRARAGNARGAREDLELAATRYPEQADKLERASDPYEARAYLRKTSSGRAITGLYQALMLGAGFFSPELQLARAELAAAHADPRRAEKGRELVREHFQRRRQGKSWTHVLHDVDFCERILGDDFEALFPEASFLDVALSKKLFGGFDVDVENRSDVSLHNALLVLCLRFTDMHPDDYEPLAVEPTQPLVPALTETTMGQLASEVRVADTSRPLEQLVPPIRSIMFCDEGTFRVDSLQLKSERLARYKPLDAGEAPPVTLPARAQQVLESLRDGRRTVTVTPALLTTLVVRVPRELVVLAPLLATLETGTQTLTEDAAESRVEREWIVLEFSSARHSEIAKAEQLVLALKSDMCRARLELARVDATTWRIAAVDVR